ncbi:MAG: class I SAM-dependent methyltransferase [Sedimentisphaerales bacterium]|nr:class I SAM-dependent methyltransferase [Sedimentisphaerales bacterium]
MNKIEKCPLCHSDKLHAILEKFFEVPAGLTQEQIENEDVPYIDERLWVLFERVLKNREPSKFNIEHCQACGFIFYNPRFTHEEIIAQEELLNVLLAPKWQRGIRVADPVQRKGERAKRIYNLITAFQKASEKYQRILDYGGNEGFNLSVFIKKRKECFIVDFKDFWHIPGAHYLGKDINILDDNHVFDIILLCHVMEHLNDPGQMLHDLQGHLREGGLLFVEVPLGSFAEWKHMPDPTLHMNFFSEESLYKALRMNGYDVLYMSTKYQWVTHYKMLCINALACKQTTTTLTKYKTTEQQMDPADFFWYLFRRTPLKHTKRTLLSIIKR